MRDDASDGKDAGDGKLMPFREQNGAAGWSVRANWRRDGYRETFRFGYCLKCGRRESRRAADCAIHSITDA